MHKPKSYTSENGNWTINFTTEHVDAIFEISDICETSSFAEIDSYTNAFIRRPDIACQLTPISDKEILLELQYTIMSDFEHKNRDEMINSLISHICGHVLDSCSTEERGT